MLISLSYQHIANLAKLNTVNTWQAINFDGWCELILVFIFKILLILSAIFYHFIYIKLSKS